MHFKLTSTTWVEVVLSYACSMELRSDHSSSAVAIFLQFAKAICYS